MDLNSFWFCSRSAGEATGRCYVQVFVIRNGGTPDLTGCYEFTAAKQGGLWRFSRWVLAIEQAQLQTQKPGPGVLEDLKGRIDVRHDVGP